MLEESEYKAPFTSLSLESNYEYDGINTCCECSVYSSEVELREEFYVFLCDDCYQDSLDQEKSLDELEGDDEL